MEETRLQYREKTVRGTEDFPFSSYRFVRKERVVALHWHPEVEILYVVNGQMKVNVSEEQYILNPGDIFFINPEELHGMSAFEREVEYYVMVFYPSLFQFQGKHFLEQDLIMPLVNGRMRLPRVLQRGHKTYAHIQPTVHRIFYDDADSKTMIYADLTRLFCVLLEESLVEKQAIYGEGQNSELIKKCIGYMEQHQKQKITLAVLAELAHMSPNYFCSYFKKYTGVSPFTQLNYIRVKSAESMLLKSDKPILQIAESCGFENVSFFIRKFKEIMGCTPSAYRRRMKG